MLFFLMIRRPPRSTRTDTLFPYATLFRSSDGRKRLLHPRRQNLHADARLLPQWHHTPDRYRTGPQARYRSRRTRYLAGRTGKLRTILPDRECRGNNPCAAGWPLERAEERRVGNECVSTVRSHWWRVQEKQ